MTRLFASARRASGSGTVYTTPLSAEFFDGYDNHGDLFADGFAKPLIKVIEIALMPSLALTLGLVMAGAPEREEES